MMGQQCRSESLFYYFRIEDHVPESHQLRLDDWSAVLPEETLELLADLTEPDSNRRK